MADVAAAEALAGGASYAAVGAARGISRQAARTWHQKWQTEQQDRRDAVRARRQGLDDYDIVGGDKENPWPPRPWRFRAPAGQWTVTLIGGPLDSQTLRVPVGDDAYPFVDMTGVFGSRQARHARYSPGKPGDNEYHFTGEYFIRPPGPASTPMGQARPGAAVHRRDTSRNDDGPSGVRAFSANPAPQHRLGPQSTKRVHELAAEFGFPSTIVLATLQSIGAYVKSALSTVDAYTAQRLRDELRNRPPRTTTSPSSADSAGVTPDGEPADEAGQAPLTGLAETLRGTFLQIQTDEEARHLAAEWGNDGLFTDEEVIAWCQSGVAPREYARARQLHIYGIRPHHLELVLQGASVNNLLRGGNSVTWVVGLLRRHGHIDL